MSLMPLFSEMDAFKDVDQLFVDTFGHGIHPGDIFRPRQRLFNLQPRNPFPYITAKRPFQVNSVDSQQFDMMPHVGKHGFQVCVDVSQFAPNELTVKTVDKTVVVEGKHEEREDEHGYIQRHFIRKYTLPKDYDPNDVISTISTDGVLTVKVAPPSNDAKNKERIVQIQQTGPAHLHVKHHRQEPVKKVGDDKNNGEAGKMES